MRPLSDQSVAARYASFSPGPREKLMDLRELAHTTAASIAGAGPLVEALKWGQPSFATPTKLGSTFRLDEIRNGGGKYALYFLCQTTLVATFRELYPDHFEFEGNRAIIFEPQKKYESADIAHCMALALTYYRK